MRLLARRLLQALPVLAGLAVLSFALVRVVPGDTATALLGVRSSDADAVRAVRQRLGLDRPLPVQFAVWMSGVARGDLGETAAGRPVREAIAAALPVTVELAALALLFALVAGIPAGVLAAVRGGHAVDRLASSLGVLGISTPGFWLGTLAILVFALELRWLPPGGFVAPGDDLAANLGSLLLPSLALGAAVAGVILRTTRAAVAGELHADHVRTARARGVAPMPLLLRHVLVPALPPVLTVAGIQAGYLLGGSVVIEQVFALPGVGRLAFLAVERRDYALLQAIVLLAGVVFVALDLCVDLLHARIDPRVRR